MLHRDTFEQDERWTAVDHYATSHLTASTRPEHTILAEIVQYNASQGLPEIAAPPAVAKFLALQCRLLRATHALEVGTLGGYTAAWLALQNPGLHVTTLEVDPHHAQVARANFERAGVADRVECILAPALDSLQKIGQEIEAGTRQRFDFAFIDADKLNNYTYVDWFVRLSKGSGCCAVVDNVVAKGRLADARVAKGDHMARGGRDVVERVGRDDRLEATLLQIVGEKDYDGFLMAVVK